MGTFQTASRGQSRILDTLQSHASWRVNHSNVCQCCGSGGKAETIELTGAPPASRAMSPPRKELSRGKSIGIQKRADSL
jgi:hypothetical protein